MQIIVFLSCIISLPHDATIYDKYWVNQSLLRYRSLRVITLGRWAAYRPSILCHAISIRFFNELADIRMYKPQQKVKLWKIQTMVTLNTAPLQSKPPMGQPFTARWIWLINKGFRIYSQNVTLPFWLWLKWCPKKQRGRSCLSIRSTSCGPNRRSRRVRQGVQRKGFIE